MTITDQIEILDIMQNEAQCDLDRKAAKISALSSNNLDKYEYLTGEDLGLKPNTIKQTRFEYSPLGKIFNKGLSEDDKKEGLFKRLENIKDKNEEQLKVLQDQLEKHTIINKVKNPSFNNLSFRNLLDDKSMKVLMKSKFKIVNNEYIKS